MKIYLTKGGRYYTDLQYLMLKKTSITGNGEVTNSDPEKQVVQQIDIPEDQEEMIKGILLSQEVNGVETCTAEDRHDKNERESGKEVYYKVYVDNKFVKKTKDVETAVVHANQLAD